MPIEFKCPKCTRALRVKDEFAGQTGLCPYCQTRVLVPVPAKVNEDSVLDWLGAPTPSSENLNGAISGSSDARIPVPGASGSDILNSPHLKRTKKRCPKCKHEVAVGYDICPHCHMYFSDVQEAIRRMQH